MHTAAQHEEAPAEVQIQNLLTEISELKLKLGGAKDILKQFKIKSDKLDQLKQAQKELKEQVDEEKERIENEMYEDKDYEQAKNDKLTYSNQIKEKTSQLKTVLHEKYKAPTLKTEDHVVSGEPVKLQLQFVPNVFLNGCELK